MKLTIEITPLKIRSVDREVLIKLLDLIRNAICLGYREGSFSAMAGSDEIKTKWQIIDEELVK